MSMSSVADWAELIGTQACPELPLEVVDEIDSTNTELMRRAREAPLRPCALLALRQHAGRGRLGRTWHSAPGQALTFSVGCTLARDDWSGLSLAMGVVLAQTLATVGMARAPSGFSGPPFM